LDSLYLCEDAFGWDRIASAHSLKTPRAPWWKHTSEIKI